ncbi:MAG: VOC family protein [Alphaproteobacteria bacterium]|nr:VOC family protein [Alphaproteobacteria bacterium]
MATCAEGIEMTGEVLRIDYVELVADDFAAARHFYSEVFGWEFKVWGDDYVEILNAGLGGGFRRGDRPVSDGTVVIIYADDIDAVEVSVKENGGEVISHEKFPGGRRFLFRDPCGNVVGVWRKDGSV